MECKTCGSSLRSDFSYCPNCGAKIIRNRLTLKNVWQDLTFQVFNLDNTLFKTIRHLITKPEAVVESYIEGARKKYMNPISFFAIAITLSGLLFFLLRNVYHVNLLENSLSDAKTPNMEFVFDYQGIMAYLITPIYALITWLLFIDIKKLNYTEHLVANTFTTGQVSFFQFLVSVPLFGFFNVKYDIFNWLFIVVSVIYQFYVFGRIHKTGFMSTFFRGLGYLFLMVFVMLLIGIALILVGLLTGALSLQDFAPPK